MQGSVTCIMHPLKWESYTVHYCIFYRIFNFEGSEALLSPIDHRFLGCCVSRLIYFMIIYKKPYASVKINPRTNLTYHLFLVKDH